MPRANMCGTKGRIVARLVFDEEFLREWSGISSQMTVEGIDRMLELIAAMPGVGSSIVADSVRLAYGPRVLKALVGPYQIIYEHDCASDTVYVYGLLYGPSIV